MTSHSEKNIARLSPKLKFMGLGVSAILSFACGSSDKGTTDSTDSNVVPPTTDVTPPKAETCDDNPLLAGCSTAGNSNAVSNKPTPALQRVALTKVRNGRQQVFKGQFHVE